MTLCLQVIIFWGGICKSFVALNFKCTTYKMYKSENYV
jgi:hypothetical protein